MQALQTWKLSMSVRIAMAILFGAVVGGMALDAGWEQAYSRASYRQMRTQHDLDDINKAISVYREQKHTLPQSLGQLEEIKDPSETLYALKYIHDGQIEDGWYRPFVYTVQGDHYLVVSYGDDGKPGGIGLDTDLTSANPRPPEARMTLAQLYAFAPGIIDTAWITGILAAVLCFGLVRPAQFTRQNVIPWLIGLGAALFAATTVGMIITALHVPTGH